VLSYLPNYRFSEIRTLNVGIADNLRPRLGIYSKSSTVSGRILGRHIPCSLFLLCSGHTLARCSRGATSVWLRDRPQRKRIRSAGCRWTQAGLPSPRSMLELRTTSAAVDARLCSIRTRTLPMVLAEGKARHGARAPMNPISVRHPGSFLRGFCTSCVPNGRTCTFRPLGPRLLRLSAKLARTHSGTGGIGCKRPAFRCFCRPAQCSALLAQCVH
jgi:hypothetical protein